MRIVALNGSPNKDGNTFNLLNQSAKYLKEKYNVETNIINIASIMQKQKVSFCIACSTPCLGKCFQGTELEQAYEDIAQSDGVLIGSPVYFGTVSAQLKAFWDKSRKIRGEKKFLNLPGGVFTVGTARFGGQETTMKAIFDMMLVQGMIIVGDGHIDFDCGHQGVAASRPSLDDANALKRCEVLAERVYQVAQVTKALRKG